jgi:hypothetical protein
MTPNDVKPTTFQRDLANLPPALLPLIERPQWCVWRWTQKPDGKWQKPPFQAKQPDRHASTTDPSTWADYATALATVQAGHADGISSSSRRMTPSLQSTWTIAAAPLQTRSTCGHKTICKPQLILIKK